LDSGAVTTIFSIAPGNHSSIGQDRSKSTACGINLLNIPELILDSGAPLTSVWMAPGHYASICQNGSESKVCATNLLHVPQLILDSGAVTTKEFLAQQNTTLPFAKIAAKAYFVPQIC